MHIYIPTLGRVSRQMAWECLSPEIQAITQLVCSESESHYHSEKGRNILICPHEKIVMRRQWILDYAAIEKQDKIVMLDDDIFFLKRIIPEAWNLTKALPGEVDELFYLIEALLDDFIQVGVSPRGGNNRFFPANIIVNSRVTNLHAYNIPRVVESGVKFCEDDTPVYFTMEDFHLTLSLLEKGISNVVITNWAWDQQSGSNSEGGCSLYRNGETQKKSAEYLKSKHLDFVKLREKKTKTQWSGVQNDDGDRTDVTIYWKRAYEEGVKNSF